MSRFGRAFLSASTLAVLAVVTAGRADSPPAAATTPSTSTTSATETPAAIAAPKPEPAPAPPSPQRERTVSNSLASELAASMPKYNPPPKPAPDDEEVDLREVDKPRNRIIRLPKYVVTSQKPPVFTNRELYTSRGLTDLARRRYLTSTYRLLNTFYIPLFSQSGDSYAMARYDEDERLQNMSDLKDTASTLDRADSGGGDYVSRLSNETYMRHPEFGYNTGPQTMTGGSRY